MYVNVYIFGKCSTCSSSSCLMKSMNLRDSCTFCVISTWLETLAASCLFRLKCQLNGINVPFLKTAKML